MFNKPDRIQLDFSNGDSLLYAFRNNDFIMNTEKIILADIVVAYSMKITLLNVKDNGLEGVCISEVKVD